MATREDTFQSNWCHPLKIKFIYTMLHFWVTTCQGIVQYTYRYTKASKGALGDSLLDSFLQNHNL